LSYITFYHLHSDRLLTTIVRMLRQMRTHSSRLKQRNVSDRRRCEKCRKRSIAHASKMLSEKWTRFRVESGILKKKRGSGRQVPRLNNQEQVRRRQLHKRIPEIVKPKPGPVAEGGWGGVARVVEEGRVKAETDLDYIIYWRLRFNHIPTHV